MGNIVSTVPPPLLAPPYYGYPHGLDPESPYMLDCEQNMSPYSYQDSPYFTPAYSQSRIRKGDKTDAKRRTKDIMYPDVPQRPRAKDMNACHGPQHPREDHIKEHKVTEESWLSVCGCSKECKCRKGKRVVYRSVVNGEPVEGVMRYDELPSDDDDENGIKKGRCCHSAQKGVGKDMRENKRKGKGRKFSQSRETITPQSIYSASTSTAETRDDHAVNSQRYRKERGRNFRREVSGQPYERPRYTSTARFRGALPPPPPPKSAPSEIEHYQDDLGLRGGEGGTGDEEARFWKKYPLEPPNPGQGYPPFKQRPGLDPRLGDGQPRISDSRSQLDRRPKFDDVGDYQPRPPMGRGGALPFGYGRPFGQGNALPPGPMPPGGMPNVSQNDLHKHNPYPFQQPQRLPAMQPNPYTMGPMPGVMPGMLTGAVHNNIPGLMPSLMPGQMGPPGTVGMMPNRPMSPPSSHSSPPPPPPPLIQHTLSQTQSRPQRQPRPKHPDANPMATKTPLVHKSRMAPPGPSPEQVTLPHSSPPYRPFSRPVSTSPAHDTPPLHKSPPPPCHTGARTYSRVTAPAPAAATCHSRSRPRPRHASSTSSSSTYHHHHHHHHNHHNHHTKPPSHVKPPPHPSVKKTPSPPKPSQEVVQDEESGGRRSI